MFRNNNAKLLPPASGMSPFVSVCLHWGPFVSNCLFLSLFFTLFLVKYLVLLLYFTIFVDIINPHTHVHYPYLCKVRFGFALQSARVAQKCAQNPTTMDEWLRSAHAGARGTTIPAPPPELPAARGEGHCKAFGRALTALST